VPIALSPASRASSFASPTRLRAPGVNRWNGAGANRRRENIVRQGRIVVPSSLWSSTTASAPIDLPFVVARSRSSS
jgi:hypothetical protein